MSPPTLITARDSARTKIVVINIANAVEPCFRLKESARHPLVPRRFHPAHAKPHPAPNDVQEDAILANGRQRRAGEFRVSSSHYAAWQDLQSDDADQYVVLEVNLIVDWAFLEKLSVVSLARIGIDYLRLHYRYPTQTELVKENFIEPERSIIAIGGTALGAQAYTITKAGARFFLDHCRIERRPIYGAMDHPWTHGQRHLSIFPFPVIERSAEQCQGNTQLESLIIPRQFALKRTGARCLELQRCITSPIKRRCDR
jgi:glycosyl transferase family 25